MSSNWRASFHTPLKANRRTKYLNYIIISKRKWAKLLSLQVNSFDISKRNVQLPFKDKLSCANVLDSFQTLTWPSSQPRLRTRFTFCYSAMQSSLPWTISYCRIRNPDRLLYKSSFFTPIDGITHFSVAAMLKILITSLSTVAQSFQQTCQWLELWAGYFCRSIFSVLALSERDFEMSPTPQNNVTQFSPKY